MQTARLDPPSRPPQQQPRMGAAQLSAQRWRALAALPAAPWTRTRAACSAACSRPARCRPVRATAGRSYPLGCCVLRARGHRSSTTSHQHRRVAVTALKKQSKTCVEIRGSARSAAGRRASAVSYFPTHHGTAALDAQPRLCTQGSPAATSHGTLGAALEGLQKMLLCGAAILERL